SAAFLMATTQLLVRNNLPRVCDPGFCLEEVNRQLCIQVFHGQFVTMQILVIDPENKQLEIASAGHPPPLMVEDGQVSALGIDPQLVLGVDEATEYPTQRFSLNPGAALLLYTDGVSDVVAPSGQRLTDAGLRGAIPTRLISAQSLLAEVLRNIDSFRLGRDLSDDLTVVALHFQPTSAEVEALAASK